MEKKHINNRNLSFWFLSFTIIIFGFFIFSINHASAQVCNLSVHGGCNYSDYCQGNAGGQPEAVTILIDDGSGTHQGGGFKQGSASGGGSLAPGESVGIDCECISDSYFMSQSSSASCSYQYPYPYQYQYEYQYPYPYQYQYEYQYPTPEGPYSYEYEYEYPYPYEYQYETPGSYSYQTPGSYSYQSPYGTPYSSPYGYEYEYPYPTPTFPVTVNKASGGTETSVDGHINCGTTCVYNYDENSTVTLQAKASSGYWKFTGWSGDCSGAGDCVLNVNGPKTVTPSYILRLFDYKEF